MWLSYAVVILEVKIRYAGERAAYRLVCREESELTKA